MKYTLLVRVLITGFAVFDERTVVVVAAAGLTVVVVVVVVVVDVVVVAFGFGRTVVVVVVTGTNFLTVVVVVLFCRTVVVVVEAQREDAVFIAELLALAAVGNVHRGLVEGVSSLVGNTRQRRPAGAVLVENKAEFLVGSAQLRKADGLAVEIHLCRLPFSDNGGVFFIAAARQSRQHTENQEETRRNSCQHINHP